MKKFTETFLITKNFNDIINDDVVVYDEKGEMVNKVDYFNGLSHERISLNQTEKINYKGKSYQIASATFDDDSVAGIMLIGNNGNKTFFYINIINTYTNNEKGYLVLEDSERLYLYFVEDGSFYIH